MIPLQSRRLGAALAASALSVSVLTAFAAPAQAAVAHDDRPVQVGATWLEGELVNGVLGGTCGPFDCGNTIDAGLALKAIGGHQATVDAIGTGLATPVVSYLEPTSSFGGDDYASKSAGATGKTLLLLRNLSTPTNTIASIDLLTRLESMVATTAPIAGRIEDVPTKNGDPDPASDYANVVGQTFAAAALFAAGSEKADEATDFLLTQQCDAGFFRVFYPYDVNFAPDKTGPQDCQSGVAGGQSEPDVDATATAVRLLQPQAAGNEDVEAALADATAWLLSQQQAGGAFIAGFPVLGESANSTGLAGWALGLRGEDTAAEEAAFWLRRHQADEIVGCANALSDETGAMASTDGNLATALTAGIPAQNRDSFRRATAQSLPALAYAPAAAGTFAISGPTGFVKGGTSAAYQIIGAAPGGKLCVSSVAGPKRLVAGVAGTAGTTVAMPAVTAGRVVTVKDPASNSRSVLTKVLGPKTFTVRTAATVKRGAQLTVVVTGLAPGEKVRVNLRGVLRRSGFAGPGGRFVATFVATRPLGKASVTALGEFPVNRRGATTVTVVR